MFAHAFSRLDTKIGREQDDRNKNKGKIRKQKFFLVRKILVKLF